MGDNLSEIRKNAREIADKIVADGVIMFDPELFSITIQPKSGLSGIELERLGIRGEVVNVVYTIHKQPTGQLFTGLSTLLLSNDLRTSGGFYNIAEKLSVNHFSEFTIIVTPFDNEMLRELHVSLLCSNEIRELIKPVSI